ncbi:hypothetical protein [Methanogenium cariaci]|uniref:hypothetical protein n=1 Tax=Methanogenium cariaci TaxID=2197 RepID=UPI001FE17112|nr:hypothetical protein [Methanogenium cariaci]
MTPALLAAGLGIAVVLSLLAGGLPGNEAARLNPVDAIRRGDVTYTSPAITIHNNRNTYFCITKPNTIGTIPVVL